MSQKYPENPLFKEMVNVAYELGQAPSGVSRSPKAVDLSQYKNLTGQPVNTANTKQLTQLGNISTPYGGSTRYESFHPGIDVAAPTGTPIPAFTSGVVTGVQSGKKQGDSGFGNYVTVTDPYGGQHRYSHLYRSNVKIGDTITKGVPIGLMGSSGQTYSPSGGDPSHLDYRIRDAYGKYVNPLIYLSAYNEPI